LAAKSVSGFPPSDPMTEPAPLQQPPAASFGPSRSLARRARALLSPAGRFAVLTLRTSGRGAITLHASALAFRTACALLPPLALLRRQTAFDRLWHESTLFMAIPFVVTTCGLTMLYWLVPNTAVRARYALAGGASAALLLEALRAGFKLYLAFAPGLSLVYGGFALALIFMVSIDAAWTIVLLGCEISYTAQHFASMARRRRTIEPLEGGWLGLAVLSLVAEAQRAGAASVALEDLASRLELPSDTLRLAVAPLVAGRWLKEAGRRGEGLRLGIALGEAKIEALFKLYDGR